MFMTTDSRRTSHRSCYTVTKISLVPTLLLVKFIRIRYASDMKDKNLSSWIKLRNKMNNFCYF